jgi:hypothetical protein
MAFKSPHLGEGFYCDVQIFAPDSTAKFAKEHPEEHGVFPLTHVSTRSKPDLIRPGEIVLVVSTGFILRAALSHDSRIESRRNLLEQMVRRLNIPPQGDLPVNPPIWRTGAWIYLCTPKRPEPRGQVKSHVIATSTQLYIYASTEPLVQMYYNPDQLPKNIAIERCQCGTWLVWLHKEVDSYPL